MSTWGIFWICLAVYWCVYFIGDTYLYLKGHDTGFWQHKTEFELKLQEKQLESYK